MIFEFHPLTAIIPRERSHFRQSVNDTESRDSLPTIENSNRHDLQRNVVTVVDADKPK